MIDTKALRSRVLDLAIQGKLTEQLESDGSAEELCKSLGLKIKETAVPFSIPNNWIWCKGKDCFRPMETRKPTGDFFEYIDIDAIDNKKLAIKQARRIPISDAPSRASRAVFDGSVLFSLVRPYLHNIAFVSKSYENCIASTGFFVATSNGLLYPDYLYYLMISDYVVMGLNQYMKGDNSPSIRKGHIEQWLFPIPPLAEQKRIVARVEEIFRLLDIIDAAQEQYAADAESLKTKLITLGIQGRLTEQLESDGTAEELYQQIQAEKQRLIKEGKIKREKPLPEITPDEIPFEIPENWKWVRWGEIVNIVSARRVHQSDWKTEGVPFYRAREIARLAENGYVDNDLFISEELYNEFSKSGIPHAGDIMISAVGTLGKAYVVKANDKFYYKDASVLCIENIGHIIPEFLIWVMRSDFMRSQIASNSGGTTVDTLTMVRMIKYLFPLPPLAEQKRIAETLERVLGVL